MSILSGDAIQISRRMCSDFKLHFYGEGRKFHFSRRHFRILEGVFQILNVISRGDVTFQGDI